MPSDYLRERCAKIATYDSRHLPHWTQADLEAVLQLLARRPAAQEQIALGRIEGIAGEHDGNYTNGGRWRHVRNIARAALDLKPLT